MSATDRVVLGEVSRPVASESEAMPDLALLLADIRAIWKQHGKRGRIHVTRFREGHGFPVSLFKELNALLRASKLLASAHIGPSCPRHIWWTVEVVDVASPAKKGAKR